VIALPPKTLYFDESNFTGSNFLDVNQPIFVVSSSDIGDDEAESILKTAFPTHRASEFKFGNVWSDRKRKSLTKLAEQLGTLEARLYSYVIDKKFGVLIKALDFLVEPIVSAAGFDWYKGGYCWKYTNWAYFGLTKFGPPKLYDAIVRTYQRFSCDPTKENLARMQHTFRTMANSCEGEYLIILQQLALGASLFEGFNNLETFAGSNELQVTTMVAHVAAWRQRCENDFIVVHDSSSNFYRRRELWTRIVGPDAPPHVHPIGDGTTVQYPLRVIETKGRDSKESYAIQLCDLMAGLTSRCLNPHNTYEDHQILNDLLDAGLSAINYNGIYFRPIFPEGSPRLADGPDAADLMTSVIFRRR